MTTTSYTINPIGFIDGCYPDKFGVPRQPGLVPSATARIPLQGEYAQPDAVRGLEEFSHLWLIFLFHLSPEHWTPLVRPPRLGGNKRVGVFASRSTHRPNRLGQSLVELLEVECTHGVNLLVRGHDLVNGTPIMDIKPYLPWTESIPDARAGFAPTPPTSLPVYFSMQAQHQLAAQPQAETLRELIIGVLAQDPRPAYHRIDPDRRYGVHLGELDVRFHLYTHDGHTAIEVLELVNQQ